MPPPPRAPPPRALKAPRPLKALRRHPPRAMRRRRHRPTRPPKAARPSRARKALRAPSPQHPAPLPMAPMPRQTLRRRRRRHRARRRWTWRMAPEVVRLRVEVKMARQMSQQRLLKTPRLGSFSRCIGWFEVGARPRKSESRQSLQAFKMIYADLKDYGLNTYINHLQGYTPMCLAGKQSPFSIVMCS